MKRGLILLLLILVTAACGTTEDAKDRSFLPKPSEPTATEGRQLTPYLSPTVTQTPLPADTATPLPTPEPTATPFVHIIQEGEEMLAIAIRYGVSLDALMSANPEVDPNMLLIGTGLIIPVEGQELVAAAVDSSDLPTPIPLNLTEVNCWSVSQAGIWCFLLAQNPGEGAVESVSARVDITAANGNSASKEAEAVLNLLPVGEARPLVAYFSPLEGVEALNMPLPLQISTELLTALPVSVEAGRYLPLRLENVQTEIHSSGLYVEVSGDLRLDAQEGQAEHVQVAALAYDQQNRIVGVRRWENSRALLAGETMPFALRVYTADGIISKAEVFAEGF